MQKAKFRDDRAVLALMFTYLAPFFPFAGHFIGVISVENVSGKAFRILGLLDESKGRWVVKQDFQGNFMANGTWFFFFFFDLLD